MNKMKMMILIITMMLMMMMMTISIMMISVKRPVHVMMLLGFDLLQYKPVGHFYAFLFVMMRRLRLVVMMKIVRMMMMRMMMVMRTKIFTAATC